MALRIDPSGQAPVEVRGQVGGHPGAAVVLVVPGEDVGAVDRGEEREQVAVACVREKEEWVERHVEGGELSVLAQSPVLYGEALGRPDETVSVFVLDAVGLP